MTTPINNNLNSVNAQRSLATFTSKLRNSSQKLSQNKTINSAKDDAAGLKTSDSRSKIKSTANTSSRPETVKISQEARQAYNQKKQMPFQNQGMSKEGSQLTDMRITKPPGTPAPPSPPTGGGGVRG